MKVTLMGPDDDGKWFLADRRGNDFAVVEAWEDHPAAAKLLGWMPTDDEHNDETIEDARAFLLKHVGEDFTAPLHIANHFQQEGR
jgi:hypothetical protein